MPDLSAEGKKIVKDLAHRFEVSEEAVRVLLQALSAGGGTMAQFNHPDLGGMGQWAQGGMIMIGDMFNNDLKSRVSNLCRELAKVLQEQGQPVAAVVSSATVATSHSQESSSSSVSLFVAGSNTKSAAGWWPEKLGAAASTGSQNELRYAYFPELRRLAILVHGQVTVYDTGEHKISSFAQQQSSDQSLSFTSQLGLVRVENLPVVKI